MMMIVECWNHKICKNRGRRRKNIYYAHLLLPML